MTLPTPSGGRAFGRSVVRAAGLATAVVLVVAAGVAGWFGVERFALAGDDGGSVLEPLGSGLPIERMERPAPWRRVQVDFEYADRGHRVEADADTGEMRFRIFGPEVQHDFVARGDVGFERSEGGWMPLTADQTVAYSALFSQNVGPYVLTDVVPPAAIPHTTLHSETEVGELRVYAVSIDATAFRFADPLGHDRWLAASGELDEGPARRVIHVRPDGYVVRIDRDGSTRVWTDPTGPILQDSPLDEPQPAAPLAEPGE